MKKVQIKFSQSISMEAIQLISEILIFDPKLRLSINAIKNHSWVIKMKALLEVIPIR